ncbi:hypothetical protein DL93DRAFT_812098 [Clavulina sp. PMI_390]|nr:hypothetical protein DL93DRAFT_812098 [Clavulina sp. PMI_390]
MTSELVVTPRFDRTQVQDPNIWQRAPTSRDQDAIADAYTIELHPPSQDAPSSSGTHATLKNHQLTSAHPLFNRVPRFRRAEVSYAEVYIEPRSPHTFLIMELEIPDYLSRPNKTWLRIERRVDPDQKISYLRQLRSRTKAADWVRRFHRVFISLISPKTCRSNKEAKSS